MPQADRITRRSLAVVDMAERTARLGYFVFDPVARRTVEASAGVRHIVNQVYNGDDQVSIERLFTSVHDDDRSDVIEAVNASISGRAPLNIEFRVIGDSGEIFHLALSNAIIPDDEAGSLRVGIVQDVTEQRQRELQLSENVALRQAITDAALDAIVITDEHGVIIEFNPNAEALFGYTRDDVVGLKISDKIVPERHRAAHDAGMKRYLREGTPHVIGQRVEIEAIKRDGTEFPIELTVLPVRAGGRLLFTANIRDITDRREVEYQLRKAKEDAEAANIAKSEFLAAMSHEIRTPLNGVLGIMTLLGDTDLSAEQRRLLNSAYASGQNLFALISDVLDLSKIEAGRMEHEFVDFNPLTVLREAIDLASAVAHKKQIKIIAEPDDVMPSVRSDQSQIRQVLSNLLANAVKFTEKGSVTARVMYRAGRLRFEVQDTGIGISPADQKKLFQRFVQVDHSKTRRYGGSGLGLAICRELIIRLQGDIGVSSEVSEGSTFWFEVPVDRATRPVADCEHGIDAPPDTDISGRILLAEDSQTNALVAMGFLRPTGASVYHASDGLEVLTACDNDRYDLIIMDVSMPEMDGIQAARELRARPGWTSEVPILALTANASREDRARCLEAGMNAFLTKPVERTRLLSAVSDLLAEKTTRQNEPANSTNNTQNTGSLFHQETIDQNFSDFPELFDEIIEQFETELVERLHNAETALRRGDLDHVRAEGHAIKGAAINVACPLLSAAGRNLEEAGRTGDRNIIERAFAHLQSVAGAAQEEMKRRPMRKKAS